MASADEFALRTKAPKARGARDFACPLPINSGVKNGMKGLTARHAFHRMRPTPTTLLPI
jgi:hypothetical protein